MNSLRKGFTLIELLVVIAIIGILAAIIVANLNTSRDLAKDSSGSATLSSARATAELHYVGNGNSYATLCDSGSEFLSIIGDAQDAIDDSVTPACNDAAAAYAAQITLSDGASYYCIDSGGYAGTATTALSTATDCPGS